MTTPRTQREITEFAPPGPRSRETRGVRIAVGISATALLALLGAAFSLGGRVNSAERDLADKLDAERFEKDSIARDVWQRGFQERHDSTLANTQRILCHLEPRRLGCRR